MLVRFPDEQEEWRPPPGMTAALTLVSWVTGPARVLYGLLPSAQARSERRR
jgi:hypothetical protein